ncbi:MAG: acyl-CoA dehydrogenase family protein [Deltaproteobacteria bacterium]|nr:acyl-CoA dehydrogenase family protein [Deltaproteobacteria bacterium]
MHTNDSPWVQKARALGATFASRAAAHDRSGQFVGDNYADLKAGGFFAAGVPQELGGGGASHAELGEMLRELAHHCGATALALSMHQHLVAAAVWRHRHGQPAEALLRAVAGKNLVLVSTGAGDWLRSNGHVERVAGGFRVSARKPFCSGSPQGDLLISSAAWNDPEQGDVVLHFSVPFTSEGVHVGEDWDTLGMRGTGSQTVELRNVFVPDERVSLKRPRDGWHPVWSVVATVAVPVFMAPYLGIAESAAKLALAHIRERQPDPITTLTVGQMQNALFTARLAWDEAVRNANGYEFTPDIQRADVAFQCKTLIAQNAISTVTSAMELAGGAGFFRSLGLERLFRDAQGAAYHVLPAKQQQQFAGRVALGLDPAA